MQARLLFFLGRLQLRRDLQEMDYTAQVTPLGGRASRAVDAGVQVEQATVSELGVQSEAVSLFEGSRRCALQQWPRQLLPGRTETFC